MLAGTYLFFPATLAFDQLEFVGAGAWLGVCAALIPLGAGAAYLLSNQARLRADVAREEAVGRLITLVGLALVLAGVWLPVDTSNDGTYWNVTGAGHSLGILFLILIGICALSVLAASRTRRRAANLLAAGAALVLFGLVLFVPVSSAFNQLDSLRAGAWLSLAGGAVLAVGTVMAWTSPARGPFEGP